MSGVAVKRIWNMEEKEKRKSDECEIRADKAGVLREKSVERKKYEGSRAEKVFWRKHQ